MHFLLGWPATLKLPSLPPLRVSQPADAPGPPLPSGLLEGVVTEPIRSFAHNLQRTKTAVVTDTAVYLFHFQQSESMCVGVWRRSPESLLAEGTNGCALFSPRDECLAVATTRHVLNVLRVREIVQANSDHNGSGLQLSQVCTFPDAEWHDECTLSAPIFHPIHLQLHSRVSLANDFITCICALGHEIVLGTRGGYIQVVSWDGAAKICVDAHAWAAAAASTSVPPSHRSSRSNSGTVVPPPAAVAAAPNGSVAPSATSTPTAGAAPKPGIVQICASMSLGLVAFVLSNGSAGVCDTLLLRPATSSASQSTLR